MTGQTEINDTLDHDMPLPDGFWETLATKTDKPGADSVEVFQGPGRPALERLDETIPALTKNHADKLDSDELEKMATDEQPRRNDLKKARDLPSHPLQLSPHPTPHSYAQCTANPQVPFGRPPPPRRPPCALFHPLRPLPPTAGTFSHGGCPPQEVSYSVSYSGFWDKGLCGVWESIMSVQVAPAPAAAKPLEPVDVAVAECEKHMLARRRPLRSRQNHGVFTRHSKFGTFQVPKTLLNNNETAAKCAAQVAEKQAAKKAAKQSKTAQKTKKGASAEEAKAVPSKAVRATPSKATAAVHMSHGAAHRPAGLLAWPRPQFLGAVSANDEPPVDSLRLGARDTVLWALLWALVAIGRRAGA